MVISYWNSIDAIKGYAGAEYTKVTTCRATRIS